MGNSQDVIRRFANRYPNRTAAAKALGISDAHLSRLINGHRQPSAALLTRIGYQRTIVKMPKEAR